VDAISFDAEILKLNKKSKKWLRIQQGNSLVDNFR
jgi:hypothetical protein